MMNASASLHDAVEKNNIGEVKHLLRKKGTKINKLDDRGNAPLHLALIYKSRHPIAEYLIDKGADVDLVGEHDYTPLHHAAATGSFEMTLKLLEKGADATLLSKYKSSPLHFAANPENPEIMQALIICRCNPNGQNLDGRTALHEASRIGRLRNVKLLVRNEATIDMCDDDGNTPLHLALEERRLSVAYYLISKSQQLNSQNNDGETPLHIAVQNCPGEKLISLLVHHGATIGIRNKDNMTAIELAMDLLRSSVAKIILRERYKRKHLNGSTTKIPPTIMIDAQ